MKELEITNEQREKFYEAVLAMQKKLEPLIEESQKDGKPEEIRPKMMKIRKEHEDRIEALLSDAQKRQWKEMLGKPLNLDE
jgi:vacuolar-type H+-ATPase subunit H